MKLLHVQIFAAAMAVGFVGTGIGLMSVAAQRREAARRLERAEADLKAARAAAAKSVVRPGGKRTADAPPPPDASGRIRALEARAAQLERENEQLKKALELALKNQQKAIPGSAYGQGAPPPEIAAGSRGPEAVSTPPPPPEPGEDWGAAEASEIDELAAVCKMNPEQRAATQNITREEQTAFNNELIELDRQGRGVRGIEDIEAIGRKYSERIEARIRQLLYPEQVPLFEEYLRKQRAEAEAEGLGPPGK